LALSSAASTVDALRFFDLLAAPSVVAASLALVAFFGFASLSLASFFAGDFGVAFLVLAASASVFFFDSLAGFVSFSSALAAADSLALVVLAFFVFGCATSTATVVAAASSLALALAFRAESFFACFAGASM
jgi:hypothetical protein